MNSSPFRSIILPALVASSATFSLLTLPLASSKTVELSTRLPAALSRWITPALTAHHRDMPIRHIGVAIVSSVLVGAGTAETMRQRRQRALAHEDLLNQALSVDGEEESPDVWTDPLAMEGAIDDAADTWRPDPEAAQVEPWSSQTFNRSENQAATSASSWQELIQLAGEEMDTPNPHGDTANAMEQAPENAAYPITYRVRVSGNQRLLAIQVDGEYYSFYRRRDTVEKARAVMMQLQRRGKTAIIAPDAKGYSIWVYQPEAVLDVASWQTLQSAG